MPRNTNDLHLDGRSRQDKCCLLKVRHFSLESALDAAKVMKKRLGGKKFQAYHCEFCGFHHVGRHRAEFVVN